VTGRTSGRPGESGGVGEAEQGRDLIDTQLIEREVALCETPAQLVEGCLEGGPLRPELARERAPRHVQVLRDVLDARVAAAELRRDRHAHLLNEGVCERKLGDPLLGHAAQQPVQLGVRIAEIELEQALLEDDRVAGCAEAQRSTLESGEIGRSVDGRLVRAPDLAPAVRFREHAAREAAVERRELEVGRCPRQRNPAGEAQDCAARLPLELDLEHVVDEAHVAG
jgi:hypothetical protein